MSDNELFVLAIFCICVFIFFYKRKPDDEGRLSDASVSVKTVLRMLEEFEVEKSEKLKSGYTEKLVQNQLRDFLRDRIQHVSDEYGIEGINATKIDLDIGNGKVGVELKLAKAVFKAAGQDRMVGQVNTFVKNKYDSDNLIVLIISEQAHLNDLAMRKQIEERLFDLGVEVLFFPLEKTS